MGKEVTRRTAADNAYLHKDFHGALSVGIDYLHEKYGEDAVREYLRQFARTFYAPLRVEIIARGLPALQRYLERLYQVESGTIRTKLSDDELTVEIDECPAIAHMRQHAYPVAKLFYETTKTVNEAICEGTPFLSEMLLYEQQTGRAVMRFRRRPL